MTTFKERPVSRSSLSDDEENKDKKKYQYSFIFKRYNPSEGSKYLIHEKGIFVLLFFFLMIRTSYLGINHSLRLYNNNV